MYKKKFFDRLLTVAFVFAVMFLATLTLLPFLTRTLHIDESSREGLLIIAVYQAVFAFIVPSVISARIITRKAGRFLHLDVKPAGIALLGVIFMYLIALPALNQIIYWNANIYFPDSIETWGATLREMEERAQEVTGVMLDTSSWTGLIVNLLVVAILTAFGEELFFRGTLQSAAASDGANHTAIWVVALIFSAFHFQIFGFIPRLLLGAWFGYLLYWTRSIYVPILAHALNNGIVVFCTWLNANGSEINFEMIGVSENGFPLAAFVSSLAIVVFLVYFRGYFFYRKKKKNADCNELSPMIPSETAN